VLALLLLRQLCFGCIYPLLSFFVHQMLVVTLVLLLCGSFYLTCFDLLFIVSVGQEVNVFLLLPSGPDKVTVCVEFLF